MSILLHHVFVLCCLFNQIEAFLNKHAAALRFLVLCKFGSDPLCYRSDYGCLLRADCLTVRLNKVLDEVKILMILDVFNTLFNHSDHIREQVGRLNSREEILITRDRFECVNGLKCDCFVGSLEVHALVQEEDCLSECIILVLIEHINKVTEEERVPCPHQLALVFDYLVDVIVQCVFHYGENVLVLIL